MRLDRAALLVAWVISSGTVASAPKTQAAKADAKSEVSPAQPEKAKPKLDRSGHKRVGEASIYSEKFSGQTMADGNKMNLKDDNAASKTLPLGTKAKVTNLETGESAEITIQDRGPYVDGRIVDLSPATAKEIGLSKKQGVTEVEVKPLEVPMPDGSVKTKAVK